MPTIRILMLGILIVVLSACTAVGPAGSSAPSQLPASGLVPSATASVPAASPAPDSMSPSAEPSASSTPNATKTPKPTKKPRPTASPTTPPIEGDIEVSFEQSSIPDPFYANTDYPIRIYVSALGQQDLPNVHVKLVAKDEGVSYKFDTGPIKVADNYYHDVTVNLPAAGPSALTVTATMPDGYSDTNPGNNSKSVDINVTVSPV